MNISIQIILYINITGSLDASVVHLRPARNTSVWT